MLSNFLQFIRSSWDISAMQKLIVTSRTYRQQSRVTVKHLKTDPENRLLARSPRLRLTGSTDCLCGERDELLRSLSNQW